MIDPPRWTEPGSDAPEEVRELLSHGVRTKSIDRRALLVTAAALTELSARPAIAGALAKLIAIPQAVAALPAAVKVVTTIAVASTVVVTSLPPQRAEHVRARTAPQHELAHVEAPAKMPDAPAPIALAPAPALEPALEPVSATPAPAPTMPAPARATRTKVRAPEPPPSIAVEAEPPIDALAAEVAWLDAARAALSGAPAQALGQANAHARRFPNAALGIERELIAIEALLRLDRKPEAERRAAELRAHFPRGLYERRLAALLE